ncbi:transposase [Nocardia sp. NBC_01388]
MSTHYLRRECTDHLHQHLWAEHCWSPSYFADGVPLSAIKEYIETQKPPK